MKINYTFLFFMIVFLLFSVKINSQTLVFTHTKSRSTFPLYTGGKYTLTTKDNKKYKGQIQFTDANSININDEKTGAITINIKDLKSYAQRRHIWYIGAWASLIKTNQTVVVEGAKAQFKPRIYYN